MNETTITSKADTKTFKDYMIFFIGQSFSLLGSFIIDFVVVLWITTSKGENEAGFFLSIFMFLAFLPPIILGPFAGVLVDRWDRKKLIILVDSLQAFATFIMILLFLTNIMNFWLLIGIMMFRGVCQAFHRPAVNSILPLMVPDDKLSRVNGLNFLINGALNIISPILAAILLNFFTMIDLFWIDIITFAVAFILLLTIQIPSINEKSNKIEEKSSFLKEFKEGFSIVKALKGLLVIMLLSTVLNLLITPLNVLLPIYAIYIHGGDVNTLAYMQASFGFAFLAGALITAVVKEWKWKKLVWFGGIFVAFAGYVIIAITPTGIFWIGYLGGFTLGFFIPIINTISTVIEQRSVPKEKMGRYSALTMGISSAATPIGYISSGFLADSLGVREVFLYSALIGIGVTIFTLLFGDLSLFKNGKTVKQVEFHGEPILEQIHE